MYCSSCGTKITDRQKFCPQCGSLLKKSPQTPVVSSQSFSTEKKVSLGYSSKIHHPQFAKIQKRGNIFASIFTFILAIGAFVGFTLYGYKSSEISLKQGLLYGAIVGGLFLLIGIFTLLKRKADGTWDGTIVKKKVKKVTKDSGDQVTTDLEYYGIVKKDRGGRKKIYFPDENVFDYFQEGDSIRVHKGFSYPEKYNKTGDRKILCIFCGTLAPMRQDSCPYCKTPLLL